MVDGRCSTFVSIETSVFSGATLLVFLLGAHPQIATVGEMDGLIRYPDEYLCSCGQRIRGCEFWQSVKTAMYEKGFEFDVAHFNLRFTLGGHKIIQYLRHGSFRNRTLDSFRDTVFCALPGQRRQLKAMVARNEAFVEAVLEMTDQHIFIDSSKHHLRLKCLLKFCTSFNVRAIHLIRDVRGVVASRLRRGVARDAREAARQWVKLNQRLRITLKSLPEEKRALVRYEDLCQDPQGTTERLYRFCGADLGVAVTDLQTSSHHIIGNNMRLRSISEIKLDERWKRELTVNQLQEIRQEAAALCHVYGYD